MPDHKLKYVPENLRTPENVNANPEWYIPAASPFSITIDGQKDAYYNTLTGPDNGWIWIPAVSANDVGPITDDADKSANHWSAWDDTYFYVYTEVNDDIVNLNNTTVYLNDGLELKVDVDPGSDDAGVWSTRLTAMDSVDVDESVWPGVDCLRNNDSNWAGPEFPTHADYKQRQTDTGYVLEFRLKWDWMATVNKGPIVPAVGNQFGLALGHNDNDDVTRTKTAAWAAVLQDAVWNNTNLMGYVEFMPDHKLKYVPENLRTPENVNANPEWYIPAGTGVSEKSGAPKFFGLAQNYPNPFNPSTTVAYSLKNTGKVRLSVFDIMGKEVAVLVDGTQAAGSHQIQFNAINLTTGLYFYKLQTATQVITKKMTLVK